MLHPRLSTDIDWLCWSAMNWGISGNCALLCLWSFFQATTAIESYISMVLIGFVVYTTDTCTADFDKSGAIDEYGAYTSNGSYARPVQCYDCSTYDNEHYCADPFNVTHPDVRTTLCYEPCAKWVRKPRPGVLHYTRKCSSDLSMQMPISLVCMKESRPGDGHLCFCRKSNCNSAPSTLYAHKSSMSPLLLLSFLTLLLIEGYFSGHHAATSLTRWLVYYASCSLILLVLLLKDATISSTTTTTTRWLISQLKMVAAYPAYIVMDVDYLSQSNTIPLG